MNIQFNEHPLTFMYSTLLLLASRGHVSQSSNETSNILVHFLTLKYTIMPGSLIHRKVLLHSLVASLDFFGSFYLIVRYGYPCSWLFYVYNPCLDDECASMHKWSHFQIRDKSGLWNQCLLSPFVFTRKSLHFVWIVILLLLLLWIMLLWCFNKYLLSKL